MPGVVRASLRGGEPLADKLGDLGDTPVSENTIFAPASGAGRAAITVVRLSGPDAAGCLVALTGRPLPPERRLVRRALRDAEGGVLDHALVVWMPAPRTFTGEDGAELHLHGGLAVRAAVLRALAARPGCRLAEPGEFARRAFLAGRLDLTEVEGLADLIDAETEAQRRQAVRQLGGALGREVAAWRDALLDLLAGVEAALDFADEDDVDAEALAGSVCARAGALHAAVAGVLAGAARGERLRDGFTIVLAGAPNAGKSTLLNSLSRRDAAIVSPEPGTTRDAIEVRCDLDGLPVLLVDTAGLREGGDAVEREGMARSRSRVADADLVLWLVEPGGPVPAQDGGTRTLVVRTKADLRSVPPDPAQMLVSATTGMGVAALMAHVAAAARAGLGEGDDALVTRERHRVALARCADALRRVAAAPSAALELVAEDLRLALRALGEVAGRVGVEDVLDRLFAGFCIGK